MFVDTNALAVLTASGSENWATPDYFFDYLSTYFGPFQLDPAADVTNAKADLYYTEAMNGLALPWLAKNVFVNPPFNREKKMYVDPWVEKAAAEVDNGNAGRVVMLLPARTDTRWFHNIVLQRAQFVYFVQGRLKFVQEGKSNSAPFPSIVVIFTKHDEERPEFRAMWVNPS